MFKSTRARECLKPVTGWKNHYDTEEIPELSEELRVSESGEYYQEAHPAMRLDLIKAILPDNRNLEEYLNEKEDSAITEVLNDIYNKKQMEKNSKEIVANDVIYNTQGWVNDTIINEGRFVGVMFRPVLSIGLKAVINRFALQLTLAQPDPGLKIYLYHSHKANYLEVFEYSTTVGGQFNWKELNWELYADDKDLSGGTFYLGYYQDDLVGNAVKYEKLNWRTGYCARCDGGAAQKRYTEIAVYVNMQSFYLPSASQSPTRAMFDPGAVIETDTNNWGFNFNISVVCDLTNFWCDNRSRLRQLIQLKVVYKILRDIQFTQQINYIEEQLKSMIIRDLEGDKETKYIPIVGQYERALKAVNFDHSAINRICIPCDNTRTQYEPY